MLVGLTGGIGSGKTTIAKQLEKVGCEVYYSDLMAKNIITNNPCVRSQVELLFGSEVFIDNRYDSKQVAKLVFAQPDMLQRLNSIVHPAVCFDVKQWAKDKTLCFVESAILYESGLSELCNKIVLVSASDKVRLSRTIQRDGLSAEAVKQRMNRQSATEWLSQKADLVVDNNGSVPIEDLAMQIITFCMSK